MKKLLIALSLLGAVAVLTAQVRIPPAPISPVTTQPSQFIAGSGAAVGPIIATAGTAGAPSVTFTGNTISGLLSCGSGCAAMSANSTTRMAWNFGNTEMTASEVFGWNSGTAGDGTIDTILVRDAANTLAMKNSTTAQAFRLYQTTTGPVANTLNMTAPTISSGFGTTPSIVAGSTAFSFRVNVGTGGAATSGVVGVPAATTGWNCQVQDMTNNVATRQTASTTNTITFTAAAAWTASDILVATCVAF